MAVEAALHAVLAEQVQDGLAAVALVDRRVVEEDQLLPLPRRLQGALQADQLPVQDLLVVGPALLLLKEPAPGAADRQLTVLVAVVVQDPEIGKALGLAELIEFGGRGPPVVVVALQDDLPARDGVDEGEVLPGAVQVHGPAQVPQQDRGVLGADHGEPRPELVHVAGPESAEDVHGLVRLEAQMQIADGVEHGGLLF